MAIPRASVLASTVDTEFELTVLSGVSGGDIGVGPSLAFLITLSPLASSLASSDDSDEVAARFLDGGTVGASALVLINPLRLDPFPSGDFWEAGVLGLRPLFLSGGNVCACLRILGRFGGVVM